MRPTDFGPDGGEFIAGQVKLAANFDHRQLLAEGLCARSLDGSFGFFPPLDQGRTFDMGTSSSLQERQEWRACLCAAIAEWLSGGEPNGSRALVLEDSYARRSDPASESSDDFHLGETMYVVREGAVTPGEVEGAFSWQTPYPAVGVLTQLGSSVGSERKLSTTQVEQFVGGAVAILAAAFDAEGYLVGQIRGRRAPRLECP